MFNPYDPETEAEKFANSLPYVKQSDLDAEADLEAHESTLEQEAIEAAELEAERSALLARQDEEVDWADVKAYTLNKWIAAVSRNGLYA